MDQLGQGQGLPDRLEGWIEAEFPNLKSYHITSSYNPVYNCIAFAVGDETRYWTSDQALSGHSGYHWPDGAKTGQHLSALQSAYEIEGFEVCGDGEMEDGYQKVALYATNDGNFQHVAKQCKDGSWKSKLGDFEDIRHLKAEWLNSPRYGQVVCFMKRPI